jgi:hypothetical protein
MDLVCLSPQRRPFRANMRRGICLAAAGMFLCRAASGLDWPSDGPLLETPADTAGQLYRCEALPWFRRDACELAVPGLTLFEFWAMGSACFAESPRSRACISGVDKLRVMFGPGRSGRDPVPPISAAELVAIEGGCPEVRDPTERGRCLRAVAKLKALILAR